MFLEQNIMLQRLHIIEVQPRTTHCYFIVCPFLSTLSSSQQPIQSFGLQRLGQTHITVTLLSTQSYLSINSVSIILLVLLSHITA